MELQSVASHDVVVVARCTTSQREMWADTKSIFLVHNNFFLLFPPQTWGTFFTMKIFAIENSVSLWNFNSKIGGKSFSFAFIPMHIWTFAAVAVLRSAFIVSRFPLKSENTNTPMLVVAIKAFAGWKLLGRIKSMPTKSWESGTLTDNFVCDAITLWPQVK